MQVPSLYYTLESMSTKYFCMLLCFVTYSSLEKHIIDTHIRRIETVRHPCPVCGKTFAKYGLKKHMMIHEGLREFNCTDCEYKSNSSTKLNGNNNRSILAVLQQTNEYTCWVFCAHVQAHLNETTERTCSELYT